MELSEIKNIITILGHGSSFSMLLIGSFFIWKCKGYLMEINMFKKKTCTSIQKLREKQNKSRLDLDKVEDRMLVVETKMEAEKSA